MLEARSINFPRSLGESFISCRYFATVTAVSTREPIDEAKPVLSMLTRRTSDAGWGYGDERYGLRSQLTLNANLCRLCFCFSGVAEIEKL